eukprot:TRINITY_DN46762_c0_g1_i1.p1 TRINITY_DN46762_c0_g1~~TRINITY_DN46762_c0_g1_i1.p1  ORF type:complete len:1158 (+),score=220.31 TRINITY_DN46762_c0_g1_i1:50-3523(+)
MPVHGHPQAIENTEVKWDDLQMCSPWVLQKTRAGLSSIFRTQTTSWRVVSASRPPLELAVFSTEQDALRFFEALQASSGRAALDLGTAQGPDGDAEGLLKNMFGSVAASAAALADVRNGCTRDGCVVGALAVAVALDQEATAKATALVAVAASVMINSSQRQSMGLAPPTGWFASRQLPTWLQAAVATILTAAATEADFDTFVGRWEEEVKDEVWAALHPKGGKQWWSEWIRGEAWFPVDGLLTCAERNACMAVGAELLSGRLVQYETGDLVPIQYQEDRTRDKVQRGIQFIGEGVATVAPFTARWQVPLQVIGRGGVFMVQNGPVGLGMLLLSDRVKDSLGDFVAALRSEVVHDALGGPPLSVHGLGTGLYYLMAYRRGYRGSDPLLAEREHGEGEPGVEAPDTDPALLAHFRHYAPFIWFSYSDDAAEVQRLAALRGFQLVGYGSDEPGKHPAYFLLCKPPHGDRKGEAILLVRGTKGAGDWLIDAAVRPAKLRANGQEYSVHRGILRGTIWMLRSLKPALLAVAHWGYTVTIVGHSLGAGVSTLMAAKLRDEGIDAKVVAFACPSVGDEEFAAWSRDWCVSCFLGDDLVPRTQLHALRDLLEVVSDPTFQQQSRTDMKDDCAGVWQRVQKVWAPPTRAAPTAWKLRQCERSGVTEVALHTHSATKQAESADAAEATETAFSILACPECLGTQPVGGYTESLYVTCRTCGAKPWRRSWRRSGDPPMLRLLMREADKHKRFTRLRMLGTVLDKQATQEVQVHFVLVEDLRRDIVRPWEGLDWGPYRRRRFASDATVGSVAQEAQTCVSDKVGGSRAKRQRCTVQLRLWAFVPSPGTQALRPSMPLDDTAMRLSDIDSVQMGGDIAIFVQFGGKPADGDTLVLLRLAERGQAVRNAEFRTAVAMPSSTPLSAVSAAAAAELGVCEHPTDRLQVFESRADRLRLLPRGQWKQSLSDHGLRSGSTLFCGLELQLHATGGESTPATTPTSDAEAGDLRTSSPQPRIASPAAGDWPRFCQPGRVMHLYRDRGTIRAALVRWTAPLLNRIEVSEQMIDDHRAEQIIAALRAVRIGPEAAVERTRLPDWEPFECRTACACCGNEFGWQKAGLSSATREISGRENCRSCGLLVCTSCCKHELTFPDCGISIPSKVCDRCYWTMR